MKTHQKQFIKTLESFDYGRNTYDKFREFCKVTTYSLASPFYPELAWKELEPIKLLEDKDRLAAYEECLNILVDALESESQDFLGFVFSLNEFGNSRNGQFFTPFSISLLCAKLQITGYEEIIQQQGLVKIMEPACGSGGMIIAVREALLNKGYNVSSLYAELTDIDELCFFMAYIQISLYGIAARVVHGDTLRSEIYRELYTPIYFLDNFRLRLLISDLSSNRQ